MPRGDSGARLVYVNPSVRHAHPSPHPACAALLRLKRKYPDRVVLLLGNRDINKMRFTSELCTGSEQYRLRNVDGPEWLPPAKRVSPEIWIRRLLAKELGCTPEAVSEASVATADTLANRIRWMYQVPDAVP